MRLVRQQRVESRHVSRRPTWSAEVAPSANMSGTPHSLSLFITTKTPRIKRGHGGRIPMLRASLAVRVVGGLPSSKVMHIWCVQQIGCELRVHGLLRLGSVTYWRRTNAVATNRDVTQNETCQSLYSYRRNPQRLLAVVTPPLVVDSSAGRDSFE